MAKFKVGDRVRGKNCAGYAVDSEISYVDISDHEIPYRLEDFGWACEHEIELVKAPAYPHGYAPRNRAGRVLQR